MGGVALDALHLEDYRLEELRKLRTALAAEIGLRESTTVTDRDKYLRAWHAAIMEVWSVTFGCQQPYPQWRQGPGKTTAPHLLAAEKFALRFFHEPPRAIAIHPARVLIIECLLLWMKHNEMPVTYGTVARNFGTLGPAVDRELPGYAAGGMLPLALKMKGSRG